MVAALALSLLLVFYYINNMFNYKCIHLSYEKFRVYQMSIQNNYEFTIFRVNLLQKVDYGADSNTYVTED